MIKHAFLTTTLLAAALPALGATPVEPADLYRVAMVEAPQVAPDGARVAFTRTRFDIGTDRRVSELWLATLDNARVADTRMLVANARNATWSPDGSALAYLGDLGGKPQLFVLALAEGAPRAITTGKLGPGAPVWSPDGRTLAFVAQVDAAPVKVPGLPPKPEGASWAPDPKIITAFTYRTNEGGNRTPGYRHIFTVAASGGTPTPITKGDFDHVEANTAPVWTRDGRALIATSNRRTDADLRGRESDLWRISLDGTATALTTVDGAESDARVSPDGRTIAYIGAREAAQFYVQNDLWVMPSEGGSARNLTLDFDRTVTDPAWSSDGRSVYALYNEAGEQRVGRFALTGGKPETVVARVGGTRLYLPSAGGGYDVKGGTIAYTSAFADRPSGLGVQRGKGSGGFDPNAGWRAGKTIGTIEELRYASKDGRPVQGWVHYPPDFDPAKRYPLILDIHGGPNTDYGPYFSFTHALYAARGYIVLFTNPRGSIGYGEEFANFYGRGYPSEDYDDLIAGVDALATRPYVDARNVSIGGGSGGGLLTLWAIGRAPDRFRAAVAIRPVSDWSIQALTSDIQSLTVKYWIGGTPWGDAQRYFERSPISLVAAVKTPTMLITGESDFRTPIAQTEAYFQALKLRGVDTTMVRLPEANHGMGRPSQWLQSILLPLDWFDKYRRP